MTKMIELISVDAQLPHDLECEWCGCDDQDKLRISFRSDPNPRFLLYCISCRAREIDGQLDQFGKATLKPTLH